jgi:hypothetical protein
MSRFDSVIAGEEWISEHYLTSDAGKGTFASHVTALRKQWDEVESLDKSTPRSGLRASATEIAAAIAGLGDDLPGTAPDDVRAVHTLLRRALGLDRSAQTWHSERSGAGIEVSDAIAHPTPTGTSLLIMQGEPAHTVEEVLDASDDGRGRLLTPATIDGKPESATTKVVSTVFLADDRPEFVLIQAGRWAVLAERSRWPEGRWLAVDLGLVAERRDVKKGGEIDHVAALLGRDTLLPDESTGGNALWTTILEESVQHTVGVSKDLREGIRLSVEIIANEVVKRRREQGLPVEGVDGLAGDLSKQALRFLYRILFLLYAEADPELGVLPSRTEEYEQGYGLDRLRELILVDLTSEQSRNGTHLYDSLRKLFDLVDQGYDSDNVPFHALRADLFQREATSLIVEVKLGNEKLQEVLRHLLLSKAKRGRDRGFISYAELGINQLGAVYEGLMSYTGFIADADLYEVAPGGDPTKGTWVVPTDRADDIGQEDLVTDEDPVTGEPRPVVHRMGTFVYRLASRERQQSASYYTPEVLTRSVVKHSLAELLDQDGEKTPALEILGMTVCEPALGSGAFAIEAVRQLAAAYLERRQDELDERIPAEEYPRELQKVKAYLALHQAYGVDLNATAVELAEVSLWLDTMHAGLQAPWFGLHLRRGNSLIGARRAVYSPGKHFAKRAWLKAVPTDVPLRKTDDDAEANTGTRIGDGIHHFLLPAEGWGAVADTAEAKRYAPEKRDQLREWRRAIRTTPTKKDGDRLARLAQRVETLWGFTLRRLEIAESEIRRHIDVWGADALPESTGAVTREQIEQVLYDENGAYRRLRRALDAWCALWFWPLTKRTVPATDEETTPPTWDSWLGGLEAILGVQAREHERDRKGQLAFTADLDWRGLDEAEDLDRSFTETQRIEQAKKAYLWLDVAEQIADEQGFFHWELDFAPVFAHGGFDLQVGNPPWVRPDWDEAGALAEHDPWWQLSTKPSEHASAERRERTLERPGATDTFLDDRAAQTGVIQHLGSDVDRPVLRGLRPDLYRCFMERTWRSMGEHGVVGLIHLESHFTELRAAMLRREAYHRLRRHFHFRNQLHMFEIDRHIEFGVHIYGLWQHDPHFYHAAWLYHPDTIDRSVVHDGSGSPPGIKDGHDDWDLRPHAERLVEVDAIMLADWAVLIDERDTPALDARMLYPVNRASAEVLDKIALAPRLGDVDFAWTSGWNEATYRRAGYFERRSGVTTEWRDAILQGPHLTVATPLYQQPYAVVRSNRDYSELDLEAVNADFIPRTNYQRAKPYSEYIASYPKWNERPSTAYFRLAWRKMADAATVRTLHAAIFPPGPAHVDLVRSATVGDGYADLAVAAGIWASLVVDFFVKVTGIGDLTHSVVRRLPHVRHHALEGHLVLRALRLNCLVQPYRPLWGELFDQGWQTDGWAPSVGLDPSVNTDKPSLGDVKPTWSWDTPLRRDADRRQALVEIDAIVAVMLDLTSDELVTIYRTQFPVLQKYEREALFDAHGRQVPRELAKEHRKRDGNLAPEALTVNGKTYALPFLTVDREKDYRLAHVHFSRLAEERS